jgi:hypothetical protein
MVSAHYPNVLNVENKPKAHQIRALATAVETDCLAGVVGLELRNPYATHVFEIT